MSQFVYIGTELELFAEAKNWKNYIKNLLKPYLQGDILEVGAGIGSNTKLYSELHYRNWCCLEPDLQLLHILKETIDTEGIANCKAEHGTIEILERDRIFDAMIYLDVLEHIESDRTEVIRATHHLKPQGNLIILSPAHQWLLTPFDRAIGHYRRYNKTQLKSILPQDLEIVNLFYLDSVGLLASLANKLILKQKMPTRKQIQTWDRLMVPLSQKLDPLLGYNLGKSILLVARKKNDSSRG